MATGVVTQPHDKFLKSLLEDPAVVLALLREHLPPLLSARLSEEASVPVDGTFIDEALSESRSDRLYRVLLKGRAKEALAVHVLLEHKSASERHAMLQVLG
jgi:predicted transposase YdaD